MSYQDPWGKSAQPDGCLAVAIRIPVRVVAVIVILPLRLLWDAARASLGWLWRYLLRPPLRALGLAAGWLVDILLVRPAVWLWRYALAPAGRAARWCLVGLAAAVAWLGRVLIATPAAWLWRLVLLPVLTAVGLAVAFVVRYVLVWPVVALWRYVLVPAGRGLWWVVRGAGLALAWLFRVLVVVPLAFLWQRVVVYLWQRVIVPVAREIAAAVAHAWRVTAYLSRAVGRGLAWLFRVLVVIPAAWVWRWTGAPALRAIRATGRWIRREILHPVRQAVADARRTVRLVLFGAPRHEPEPPAVDLRKP